MARSWEYQGRCSRNVRFLVCKAGVVMGTTLRWLIPLGLKIEYLCCRKALHVHKILEKYTVFRLHERTRELGRTVSWTDGHRLVRCTEAARGTIYLGEDFDSH